MDDPIESEKNLLESIFGDSFTDESDGSESKFTIKLVPHPGEPTKNHVSATIEIVLPSTYPSTNPSIKIRETTGINEMGTKDLTSTIDHALEELSAEKSNILYNLTLSIEEWLSHNNVNTSLSLRDQMIGRKWLEKQTLDEQMSGSGFNTPNFSRSPSDESRDFRAWDTVSPLQSDALLTQHDMLNKKIQYQETKLISSNQFLRISKGIHLKTQKCILIYIYSIIVDPHDKAKMDFLVRVLNEINRNQLDDDYIVKYLGADYSDGKLNVYTDFTAVSLQHHLKKINRFDESLLKKYVFHMVSGISYLHSKGVYGLELSPGSIFIDNNGEFKISDYLCYRQIRDLANDSIHKISDYCWPSRNQKLGNDDKRPDIHSLGESILELANGTRNIQKLPQDFSQEAHEFVALCKKKNVAFKKVMNHDFLFKEDTWTNGANFIPMSPDHSYNPGANDQEPELAQGDIDIFGASSRYHTDFEELSLLGEGGFGKVFKCRNRLDNKIYAIKKVLFGRTDSAFVNKMLREVATLSSLHHQHVVRYYNTWIGSEDDDPWIASNQDEFTFDEEETEDTDESDINYDTWDDSELDLEGENDETKEKKSSPKKILYIQMEYCTEKNLAKLIKEKLNEETAWKFFRQIIEGLNHIHSKGFIHRDLKPLNILIDSDGDIKIGDFGLAVASRNVDDSIAADDGKLGDDHTTGIGTHFYLAPEQRYERNYDQKVDIYSLGITFFEMMYFFGTEMERYHVLMKLRDGVIPDDFPKEHKELLKSLISKNPEQRPSTTELLSSVLRLEEDILKEAMNHFTKPNTTMYSLLMERIFSLDPDDSMTYMYDIDDFQSSIETSIETKLLERLKSLFMKHGAQYLETPTFYPKSEATENISKSLSILDQGGTILNVASDLVVPFANYILKRNIKQTRRFVIDKVFEKERGKPNIASKLEASFDIVSSSRSKPMIIAEMLKIIGELSRMFFGYRQATIGINDYNILDTVLSSISKDHETRQKIRSVIKRHRLKPWKDIKRNLLNLDKKITPQVLADSRIEDLYNLRSLSLQEAYDKIKNIFHAKHNANIDLATLKHACQCAEYFKVEERISFDITWMKKLNYCDDFAFYLQYDNKEIVTGACYDKLMRTMYYTIHKKLDESKRKTGTKDICAVNITVPIKKFVKVVADKTFQFQNLKGKVSDAPKVSSIDALIFSEDPNLIESRAKLALQLWSSNITAEYLYDEKKPFDKIRAECKTSGIQWIIVIKHDNKRDSIKRVKIYNSDKQFQSDIVEFDKVAHYIQSKTTTNEHETWNLKVENLDSVNERQNHYITKCFIDKVKPTLKYFDKSQELRILTTSLPSDIVKECINGLPRDSIYERTMSKTRLNFIKLKEKLNDLRLITPFAFVFCTDENDWHFARLDAH